MPARSGYATAITALIFAIVGCTRPAVTPEYHIVGLDYAFTAPDTVNAGPAVLRFENRGKVPHEMIIAEIRDDVPNAQFVDSASKGANVRALRSTGSAVLFASPNTTNNVVAIRYTFVHGRRYAIWCQFRDGKDAPRHNSLGMFKIVSVR